MDKSQRVFDYIIAGAGCAGMSLLFKLIHSKLGDDKILIIDSTFNPDENKIWSFWDDKESLFSEIVCKKWSSMKVSFPDHSYTKKLHKYTYQSILSNEFRDYIFKTARSHPNVHFEETAVLNFEENGDHVIVDTLAGTFKGSYLFQSFRSHPDDLQHPDDLISLKQHFLGWELETNKPVFNPETLSLMEFSGPLKNGVCFYYILPFSTTKALVEYTVFSPAPYQREIYEEHLIDYIGRNLNLKATDFKIIREEFGVLPMENRQYRNHTGNRIINLGTVGGMTKPSTGYAFSRIQKQTSELVRALESNSLESFFKQKPSPYIFQAYDLLLLYILNTSGKDALNIFEKLFRNNSFDRVLAFLDEKTNAIQNLQIMLSVPPLPFIKAIVKTLHLLLPGN